MIRGVWWVLDQVWNWYELSMSSYNEPTVIGWSCGESLPVIWGGFLKPTSRSENRTLNLESKLQAHEQYFTKIIWFISVQKVLKGLHISLAPRGFWLRTSKNLNGSEPKLSNWKSDWNFQLKSSTPSIIPNSSATLSWTVPAEHLLPVRQRTTDADVLSAGDDHEPATKVGHQSPLAHRTDRHLLLGLRNLRFESERNDRLGSTDEFGVSFLSTSFLVQTLSNDQHLQCVDLQCADRWLFFESERGFTSNPLKLILNLIVRWSTSSQKSEETETKKLKTKKYQSKSHWNFLKSGDHFCWLTELVSNCLEIVTSSFRDCFDF